MNPLLQAALGSILRWILALGAGYLVKAGIWTADDASSYVIAAALALLALGWSAWEKYHSRVKILTALWMPRNSTEHEVDVHLDMGLPTPAISTPVNTVPGVPK